MKPDTAINSGIGVLGTLLAWVSSEKVAILAGLATFAWMTWQLGCSMWDRWKSRRK